MQINKSIVFCITVLSVLKCVSCDTNDNQMIFRSDPPDFGSISKLRALFFPEYYKKFDKPSIQEIICSTNNVILDVSTKKCSCEKHSCNLKTSNHLRIIDTSCEDFCCRKNLKEPEKLADTPYESIQETTTITTGITINKEYKCGVWDTNSAKTKPWLVQIISKTHSSICLGTIIAPNVILTTAVCMFMKSPSSIIVRLRSNKIIDEIKVDEIIIHKQFSKYFEKLDYNIALLRLNKSIEFDNQVRPLCLPESDSSFENNDNCFVSSWEYEKPQRTYIQNTEPFEVVSNSDCQKYLQNSKHSYEKYFHDGNICAANTKKIPTQMSFSGAPLMCSSKNNSNQFIQYGILAWSTKANRSPNIFTNISKYRFWIEEKLKSL